MRPTYHHQLDGLWEGMAELARMQVVAIQRASSALLDTNQQLAELVITEQVSTGPVLADLENTAMQLLAQQQPVAGDLRLVLTTFPMSTALYRMGGLAEHIAKTVRLRAPEPAVADKLRSTFSGIADSAVQTASTLAEAIATRDIDLAAQVEHSDDGMDALHRQLFTQLLSSNWAQGVPAAVDAALLGRYYERFADQAVSVARRIRYIVTGSGPRD